MSLFTEPVILRTRGAVTGTDRYGRDTRGPDADTHVMGWYEPRQSSEDVAAREQYVEGYWLYLPLTAPTDFDAVILGGDPAGAEYELVGKPGRQPSGLTVDGFYTMALQRVEG